MTTYKQKFRTSVGNEDTDSTEKNRHFITALSRGLDVLSCFRLGERFLGNQEIARRTELPKSTVSRLTYTLTELGYLKYSKIHEKYCLGTAVLSLGNTFLGNMNIRKVARPMMQELADYAHASVAIGERDRMEMVYIENCRSSVTSFTIHLDVGSHIPLGTSAMGRAYLCGVPENERNHLLDKIRVLAAAEWPKVKAGIEQALKEHQDMGYCLSVGDWQKDINAVAVPFVHEEESEVLVFNCGGPAFQLRRHMLEDDIGPRLITLARNVKAELYRL